MWKLYREGTDSILLTNQLERNTKGLDLSLKTEMDSEHDYTEYKLNLNRHFHKEAVDEDWQRSREAGVTGVPTFYGNDLVVVGCQPYETLEKFVLHLMEMNSNQNEAG